MMFSDAGPARTYAAINGLDFDAQDNWCEACQAFHVGSDHGQDVTVECGKVEIQGFATLLECSRPPHSGPDHRTITGTSWSDK